MRFTVHQDAPMDELSAVYARVCPKQAAIPETSSSTFVFAFDGEVVDSRATARTVGLRNGDTMDARRAPAEDPGHAKCVPLDKHTTSFWITLRDLRRDGFELITSTITILRVMRDTRMQSVFTLHAAIQNKPKDMCCFLWDGERPNPQHTVGMLELQEGEQVDVFPTQRGNIGSFQLQTAANFYCLSQLWRQGVSEVAGEARGSRVKEGVDVVQPVPEHLELYARHLEHNQITNHKYGDRKQ